MTTQYQRGREDGYQHGLRVGSYSTGPTPLMRVPLSRSDFLAWWPDTVTARDLEMMKSMFAVTMDAWIASVNSKEQAVSEAEAEYQSWFPTRKDTP